MAKKPKAKKGLTLTEAAEALGISKQAVHLAVRKGHLKARKKIVTRTEWEIPLDALDSYRPSARHRESGKKND